MDRYLEGGSFPGGCYLTAAACEFDGRSGPVRDATAGVLARWSRALEAQARCAIDAGDLPPGSDPKTIAFQLNALAMGANQALQLVGDRRAMRRARRAMAPRWGATPGRDAQVASLPVPSTAGIAERPSLLAWIDPQRRPPWVAPAALGAALTAAAVFVWTRGGDLTFYVDEWDFLIHRRGHSAAVFLTPTNGHLVALPILIYKTLFAVFGAGSYVPFRLVALATALTCAALLFVLVRRRVGDGIALAATVAVLFLGPAWEPLIAPVGMIALISLAAGLGMLVALDERTRRGDLAAGGLLAVSLVSFSYGPAFAAAAAVDVLLRPGARRRIWLVILPVALYILWAVGYDDSQIVSDNIPAVPRSVADSIGADLVSLTGLYRLGGSGHEVLFDATYVPPLALVFIVLAAFRLRVPVRREPRLFALVVLALAFWVSVALVLNEGRTTNDSRYIYPGVVMLLLLCAELARGRRLGRNGLAILATATIALLVVSLPTLDRGADGLNNLGRFDRAELAALELARGAAAPGFQPEPLATPALGHHYLENVNARGYVEAVDAFGSPAYTVAELRRAPAGPRAAADQVLAAATGLAPRPVGAPGAGASCGALRPAAAGSDHAVIDVPAGGLFLRGAQGQPLTVRLRRFGGDFGPFAVALPPIPGNAGTAIPIRRDAAGVPWRAQVSGIRGSIQVCALP